MEDHNISQLPLLTAEEQRVLGALLEKSKTTPEYYPLTLNGLQTACNQKTSRRPVVNYSESTLVETLDNLRKKGLVSTVVGGGSRVVKYKHNLAIRFPLLPQELAVLCLLLLRGPLTVGELNSNSGRLYDFESLAEVQKLLDKLSVSEPNYVKQLAKGAGQKEVRYIHLLGEFNESDYEQFAAKEVGGSALVHQLEERVSTLEEQLAALRLEFDALMDQLR